MKIKPISFNNLSNIKSLKTRQSFTSKNISGHDTFVKSANKSDMIFSKEEIQKIYDEVYNEVISQNIKANPVLKRITINKPELIFSDKADWAYSGYNRHDNTINIYADSLNSERYVVYTASSDSMQSGFICTAPKSGLAELSKKLPIKYEQINKTENEFLLKASIAHELRHCIQYHLMLSCKDVSEKLKKTAEKKLRRLNAMIDELQSHSKESQIAKEKDYLLEYKPKKLLVACTLFKKSIFPNDREFWQVKDLLAGDINYPQRSDSTRFYNEYYANPLEIDAYNYESEYMMTQILKYRQTEAREGFLSCFWAEAKLSSQRGKA